MAAPFSHSDSFKIPQQTHENLPSNIHRNNLAPPPVPYPNVQRHDPAQQQQNFRNPPDGGFALNSFRPQNVSGLNQNQLMLPPPVPNFLIGQTESSASLPHQTSLSLQKLDQCNMPPGNIPQPVQTPIMQPPFPGVQNNRMSMPPGPPMVNDNKLNPRVAQPVPSFVVEQKYQDNSIQVELAQEQEDRKWLNDWLNGCKDRHQHSKTRHSLHLSEIHMKTRQMLVMIAKLQKQRQILETLRDEDKSIWDQKVLEIEKTKVELEQLQNYLTSEKTVTELNKKVLNRKKKRERLKRRRKEEYERQCEELEKREQLHNEIDRNLNKIQQKEKDAKQEKDLQKEVDQILGQVKRKMTENTRAMQLLQGLEKLRQMRKDRQERQGVHISTMASSHIFTTKAEALKTLLEKQEQTYKAEESALKVILETEQEETREKEREKDRQREVERQKREEKKVEHALFGSYKEPRPDDPLYPFKQFYDAANHSFEAFLNIRHEWDKFLVLEGTPGGSRLPDHWVMPPEPSSDTWTSALQNR